MEIIQIPEEHLLVELSVTEIRALRKALARIRDTMDAKAFLYEFKMTTDRASDLAHKLAKALTVARDNVQD